MGRSIRKAFVAEPGFIFYAADYSQIELRILAHLSGENVLLDAYRKGDDVHELTAKLLLEKDPVIKNLKFFFLFFIISIESIKTLNLIPLFYLYI